MQKIRLNLFMRNKSQLTDQSTLKFWDDESKRIMEFGSFVLATYGEKYGVTADWFSNDPKFNEQVHMYHT